MVKTVIDITQVIEPMLADEETTDYLKSIYPERYRELVNDFGDEDNAATYYLCIVHLCKTNNTDHFMIEGDIYTVAK